MSTLTIRCIKAAFLALAAGILLGASFAIDRALGAQLRPLHAELNLWGWTTLLIYGMGYHMLPRFCGQPLRRTRSANLQAWLAIGGVATACAGWLLAVVMPRAGRVVLAVGGIAQLAAALLFAFVIGELLWKQAGAQQPQPSATPISRDIAAARKEV
ncbi:MAG: cbb3-type cytochrome c oxidase subunit I [Oscillochloris sp.]|nr:cbb3-type cytochrome c oxidase subunit I [Oscillochloris sp.]